MATITDILISELDRARVPATGADELVINQIEPNSSEFVTRRISWTEIGNSIQDLAGDPNYPGVQQIYFDDGLEIEPSITFKNDTGTGIYRPILSAPAIGITVDGGEAIRAIGGGALRYVGIGFTNNDNSIPEDALHVKGGGIKIQRGLDDNNTLHLTSYAGYPFINTPGFNPLVFGTGSIERARFTEKGAFHLFGAIGLGDYPPLYSYGGQGDVMVSRGPDISPKWMDAAEWINNNADVILDILLDSDEFLEAIIDALNNLLSIDIINDNLDKLNIGVGLDVDSRDDGTGTGDTELFLYNTFVFDHLTDIHSA